jgi:glutaredoxin
MTYIIYTKSDCPSCIKAKQLLKREASQTIYINCDDLLENDRQAFIAEMRKKTNTKDNELLFFPMIFIDDTYIGNVEELVEHLIFEVDATDGYCSDYEF